jgi:hypothetical protein
VPAGVARSTNIRTDTGASLAPWPAPKPQAARIMLFPGQHTSHHQNPMRNRLASQLLKALLNHKLKEYGKMTTLHIDTQAKHISLTANLLGETEPIDATMRYVLEESDGRTFFVPQELDCSRQWLSLLAQQMLKDNVIRFEIPSGIATTVLKMLKI